MRPIDREAFERSRLRKHRVCRGIVLVSLLALALYVGFAFESHRRAALATVAHKPDSTISAVRP